MIINVGSGIKAESVIYGNSNVDEALGGLTNSVSGLTTKSNTMNSAISTLENELTANGKRIYLDYKDGKYGYNTSAGRGADTFSPFNKPNPYTQLRTVDGVSADKLGTYTGCGYITLKRCWGTTAEEIHVYIDGSSTPLTINGLGWYQFYFKQSIRFNGGNSNNGYYVQLLTSKTTVEDYRIVQSVGVGLNVVTYEGRGRILITPMFNDITLNFSLDGSFLSIIDIKYGEIVWLTFHERLAFSCDNDEDWLQFIAYIEN